MPGWRLEHSYAALPPLFHAGETPTPVREPRFVAFNRPLATALGLDADALDGPDGAAIFGGNVVPEDAQPLAQAYAGHQFGGFSPQHGDGRALLLGEVIGRQGRRRGIAFKGSGRTPFSRGGDGKAAVGPMLREVLIGEAMHALGIPTTRALAAVFSNIFEPFYTTKKTGSSVGLGLSVVYGIIRDHKGSIKVDSTVGQGTVFTIRLPAVKPEE